MVGNPESAAAPKPPAPRRGPALLRPLEYVFGPWTRENLMVWVKLIVLVLAIKWLLIEPFRVPSGSMEPTLLGRMDYLRDDRVVVNKLAYGVRLPFTDRVLFRTGDPQRFDIVVFRSVEPPPPGTGPFDRLVQRVWPKALIKRVIGLPGERIRIQNGRVFADGKPLELPKNMPPVQYTSLAPNDPITYIVEPGKDGNIDMVARGTRMRYGIWQEKEYSVVPPDAYLVLGDNSDISVDGRYFGWVPRGDLLGRAFGIWWPLGRTRDFTGFSHTWWGMLLLAGVPLGILFYGVTIGFVVRSWRVRTDAPAHGLRRGDRLRINCRAYGLRAPFSRRRLTRGRAPRPGDLVVYLAPAGNEWSGMPLLGRVAAADPNSGIYVESAEGADYPDSRHFGAVRRGDIEGVAEAVWWPVWRRRAVAPGPAAGNERGTEPSYGEED